MKILIVTAMSDELSAFMDYLACESQKDPSGHYHFVYRHHECHAVAVGIGKVNAAVNTTVFNNIYQPDLIINVGTGASLHGNIAILDVVMGTGFTYFDVDVSAFDYQYGQIPQMPAIYPLHAFASQLISHCQIDSIQKGQMVSGDAFIHDQTYIKQLQSTFPRALALDMESTAIAQSCYLLDKPFLCLRGITDHADDDCHYDHANHLDSAVKYVAEKMSHLLAVI
jgi:adenosylhomocysteine nucleosidase